MPFSVVTGRAPGLLRLALARAGPLAALLLAGCLPTSQQREEERALFPSDSLSREVAVDVPVDTLRLRWQTESDSVLQYPHTVRFGPDGDVYVGDVQRGDVYVFSQEGGLDRAIHSPGFKYPYIAGFRGDTLAVQSTGAGRLDFVTEGEVVESLNLPPGPITTAFVDDSLIYFKAVGENFSGYLTRLDSVGRPVPPRVSLPGPYWRHIGFLRQWGDTLLSLSGYRPVVDLVAEGRLDTLALVGFDSPMLARSRLFMLGRADEPPLLTSAAAPADSFLFVLNFRPGWVRVDVYDRRGQLRRVLEQENPSLNTQFYPLDLDVRPTASGGYDFAVVAVKPTPRLFLYHWDGLGIRRPRYRAQT